MTGTEQGRLSFANEERVQRSQLCACYYCLKIYPANRVKAWQKDYRGNTALCPECGIDAVVGDEGGSLPDHKTLQSWHRESFSL